MQFASPQQSPYGVPFMYATMPMGYGPTTPMSPPTERPGTAHPAYSSPYASPGYPASPQYASPSSSRGSGGHHSRTYSATPAPSMFYPSPYAPPPPGGAAPGGGLPGRPTYVSASDFSSYPHGDEGRSSGHSTPASSSSRRSRRHSTAQVASAQPDYNGDFILCTDPNCLQQHPATSGDANYFPYYNPQVSPTPKPTSPNPRDRSRSRTRDPSPSSSAPNKPTPPQTPAHSAQDLQKLAAKHGIPSGYNLKHWDPSERPLTLLGSVFDANSLGKWIYDWAVYREGAGSAVVDVAGELWLLLIQLSGKWKRAEESLALIKSAKRKQLVVDFIESARRLWPRLEKILKVCEEVMWRSAKAGAGGRATPMVSMGTKSGCEFVDAMFRDQLAQTEKLMNGMRLWSTRFDASCEEILKEPGKA